MEKTMAFFMEKGRILAIDYGERRVGLAITDPMQIIASGLTTLAVENDRHAANQIAQIISKEDITEIIIGLPIAPSGEATEKTRTVNQFISILKEKTALPIIPWEERFSTVSAQRLLIEAEEKKKRRTKEKIDTLAALVILQHYLDYLRLHPKK